MNKILIINKHNKIEEKDIDLERCCFKDFLYDIFKGEYIALNKNIDGVECVLFYKDLCNFEYAIEESSRIVIAKSDSLNGYIDIMGNYVCYYGFYNDEILKVKKYIIMLRKNLTNINNRKEKYLIYVDEYSKITEVFINTYDETIKELIYNILGNHPFTIPFKINNLECSIWFNNNRKDKINKSALSILDIGYIRGEFILSKYCRDYNYIVGDGCYALDDGFNKEEKDFILNYIKHS